MFAFVFRRASVLSQLKTMTKVVVDTGDFNQIKEYSPEDATTNPSLILSAAQKPEYKILVHKVIASEISQKGQGKTSLTKADLTRICDKLAVEFGSEILKIIPGYVSTEVDPRLSFNTKATIRRAESIMKYYEEKGIPSTRVLIKIASTWEGIKAAKYLQTKNFNCNMTLIFNYYQAISCAQVKATLISPFVGRILDWHKKNSGKEFSGAEDPGVRSVSEIYNYFKKFNYSTVVMGASFRNIGEIIELAGCDKLTISPGLLKELDGTESGLEWKLNAKNSAEMKIKKEPAITQKRFRWLMNQDPMATEKLSEGIRKFAEDTASLEKYIRKEFRILSKSAGK